MNDWNGIVSLFIACLELILLTNLLIFAEKNKLNWLAITLVTLLLGYQTIEFLICGIGIASSFMAYLAFVDITFLPPLNLFFILTLIYKKNKLFSLIFLPAMFFVIYYFLKIDEFEVVKCTVLYATFNYPLGDLYGFFYYVPIVTSFILLLKNSQYSSGKKYAIPIKYLILAHLFLIVPPTIGFSLMIFNYFNLIQSMESILCKFAFLYCLVLVYFAMSNKQKTA